MIPVRRAAPAAPEGAGRTVEFTTADAAGFPEVRCPPATSNVPSRRTHDG